MSAPNYKAGCVIDTNIFVLYLLGLFCDNPTNSVRPDDKNRDFAKLKPDLFEKSHLNHVTLDDFMTLLGGYSIMRTTPHIVSETGYVLKRELGGDLWKKVVSQGATYFGRDNADIDEQIHGFVHVYDSPLSARSWGKGTAIEEFGLADMGLLLLAENLKMPILTADEPLCNFVRNAHPDGISIIEIESIFSK